MRLGAVLLRQCLFALCHRHYLEADPLDAELRSQHELYAPCHRMGGAALLCGDADGYSAAVPEKAA